MGNFLTRTIGRLRAKPEAEQAYGPLDMLAKMAPAAGGKSGGGSKLPPLAPIKAPNGGGAAFPSWRKSITASTSKISRKIFDVANVDLVTTYRNGATTAEVVRNFARASPEMSAAFSANNRVGIPEKYISIARNPDGSFNLEGTMLAMQIIRQMNAMADYDDGFSHVGSLRSVSEALGRSMQGEGAMMVELVLDKARLPLSLQPIGVGTIDFFEDDKGMKPTQKVGGETIDLDRPTIFYVTLDPDLYDAYPQSPMEAAVQAVIASSTFVNDLRRLCARHVHPRYDIMLIEEKVREFIPDDVAAEPEKLPDYLDSLIAEVEDAINNLGVEDALIHYDFFEVKYIDGGSNDVSGTFDTVNNITGGRLATALRTPPSILGMGSTSQNLASTETLMFMLNANGMIRLKLNEIYSKVFTLAVRLFGLDVTVEFEYDDIDLRPQAELEAFRSMKQSRLLTQLSFGFITDEEYCLRTYGQLPPPGHTPLSGTMFPVVPAALPADNGNSTSTTGAKKQDNAPPSKAKGNSK